MNDQAAVDQLSLIHKQLATLTQVVIDLKSTVERIEGKLPAKPTGNLG